MKKYDIGDHVKIRRLKDLKCEFPIDYDRAGYDGDYLRNYRGQGILCSEMEEFTGLETKIIDDGFGGYFMCEISDDFRFNTSLFEE